jgi:hypothetical protein
MSTTRNGWCVHCRGRIDLTADDWDSIIDCPHCGREMEASAAVVYRRRFRRTRRWMWLGVGVLAAIGLASLVYFNHALLRWSYDLLVEETGSHLAAVTFLAAAVLAVLWLVFWMLFPLVVFIGLRDLRRRTLELEETTKLCARHLARLTSRAERWDGSPIAQKSVLAHAEAPPTPAAPLNPSPKGPPAAARELTPGTAA